MIDFSKRDGLKINGSSIGSGKNDTVAIRNYCSKDLSVASMEEAALTSHIKGKKHLERSPSDQCIRFFSFSIIMIDTKTKRKKQKCIQQ